MLLKHMTFVKEAMTPKNAGDNVSRQIVFCNLHALYYLIFMNSVSESLIPDELSQIVYNAYVNFLLLIIFI